MDGPRPEGTLIAVRIGTTATAVIEYYPFTDNVSSVRAMVKADGTLSNSYSYSAYGTTLTATEASGASQPYRYGGGYTDITTGLIKLGIRYLDPTHGRFTQQDPTGQDPHYIYAKGCPSTYNDPTGAGLGEQLGKFAGVLVGCAGGIKTTLTVASPIIAAVAPATAGGASAAVTLAVGAYGCLAGATGLGIGYLRDK